MALLRQTWTLAAKDVKIVLYRHRIATPIRALVIPILAAVSLSYARHFMVPHAKYGITNSLPIRTLPEGLAVASSTNRDQVVFVNNGHSGGDIDRVISHLSGIVSDAGKPFTTISDPDLLPTICRSSLRRVTSCYGAIVFHSSPHEGNGGLWNYTLLGDGSLGEKIDASKDVNGNDVQIYTLPLQKAVDSAIVNLNSPKTGPDLPHTMDEYPFTELTEAERQQHLRQKFQPPLTNYLGVAFIISLIGTPYHMTGFIAAEREIGMTRLIDAMMPTSRPWHAPVARILSHHISFSGIYLLGWAASGCIVGREVFASSNVAIVVFYFILCGLALTSMSILASALASILASTFRVKSQISGICTTLGFVLLGILAQSITAPSTTRVIVLSVLFTPCSFVFFITWLSRWEQNSFPADLMSSPPESPWWLPGYVFGGILVIHILVYPFIGFWLERMFHGIPSQGRTISKGLDSSNGGPIAVRLDNFTKEYYPGGWRRVFGLLQSLKEPVVGANKVCLEVGRGQILTLLGANGSGKSTTLDCIAGVSKLTSGNIAIDGTGGLGFAPQKNVMWDELTVSEHIQIFHLLKSPDQPCTREEITYLVKSVDLGPKMDARSRTLSGGQKRKLQLGMMLTGGSAICLCDEVSSGVDPLSRRKLWDILLEERGKRTIIMTSHFLDEADLLADHIIILSKGTLRAEGTSVELKDKFGGGYRIHVPDARNINEILVPDGVTRTVSFGTITFIARSSSAAAELIKTMEAAGIQDYKYRGPTIEDVFMCVAKEVNEIDPTNSQETVNLEADNDRSDKATPKLLPGRPTGFVQQTWIMFQKRCTVFKTCWYPSLLALIILAAAAGLSSLLVKNQRPVGCSPNDQTARRLSALASKLFRDVSIVAGPSLRFDDSMLDVVLPVYANILDSMKDLLLSSSNNGSNPLDKLIHFVDSFEEFNNYVTNNRKSVSPGGIWLGDVSTPPTLAYSAGESLSVPRAMYSMNILDMLLTNTSIATSYAPFALPFGPSFGKSLNLIIYMCLSISASTAFFGLYPNMEKIRKVRELQYSNGVRPLPRWAAYFAFDFATILVATILLTAISSATTRVWSDKAGYLFVVFVLYQATAALYAYIASSFCRSGLATWAVAAGSQAFGFLFYLFAYLGVITFVPANMAERSVVVVHFTVSIFFPMGSLVRALCIGINVVSSACEGTQLTSHPGSIMFFGGPILYLTLQSVCLFGILLWWDSNAGMTFLNRFAQTPVAPIQDFSITSGDLADSLSPVSEKAEGLRVANLVKAYGGNTAVENITFKVRHGEIFALLGPNGAGKSTTISLIRGDIQPSRNGGDVFVENTSVFHHRAAARGNLGVCPQFDAIDCMTVVEHLHFYAKIRGVPEVDNNVRAVLRAVGLGTFTSRQASNLSVGNQRKLSLGIALMGNPPVFLLDEPSSGMDAAAKRVMWKTLKSLSAGRSIVLTTHSMEEADALAHRAGFLAKRMLAMGTTEELRRRCGDMLHVHLISRHAPHSTDEEILRVRTWIVETFGKDAKVEGKTYHGQVRFSVPAKAVLDASADRRSSVPRELETADDGGNAEGTAQSRGGSAIGQLIVIVDGWKEKLGVGHYSVSPTTLDQVFLAVVGEHDVQEEDGGDGNAGRGAVHRWMRRLRIELPGLDLASRWRDLKRWLEFGF